MAAAPEVKAAVTVVSHGMGSNDLAFTSTALSSLPIQVSRTKGQRS